MSKKGNMLADFCYSELLTSAGYDVEFAVGTTYSLDLKSLLIVPCSLGMLGDPGAAARQSPLFLLNGIRRAAGRFVVFCQRGGIHAPQETRSYYPLLEECIVEMSNKEAPLSNFHPKLWVIKEHSRSNPADVRMKVIIMSKNLVIDNNLDMAVSMTGKIGEEEHEVNAKHRPLHDFLLRLADMAKGKQRKNVEELAHDLLRVARFGVDEDRFEPGGYEFVPFFYGEELNSDVPYPQAFQGTFVMTISPFVDYTTLKEIHARKGKQGKSVLVTRADYVTEPVMELFRNSGGSVWVMKGEMVRNDIALVDLHAKSYLVSAPKSDPGGIYFFIGSANATRAAFHRNTELLLRLKLRRGWDVFDKIGREFLQLDDKGESWVYEQLQEAAPSAEAGRRTALEIAMRELLTQDFRAVAFASEAGLYDVRLTTKAPDKRFRFRVQPLQMPELETDLSGENHFKGIPLAKLSRFYVVRADGADGKLEEIIKVPTLNLPKDRDDEIFRSIVNTKEKFYGYLSYLLCDDPAEYALERGRAAADAASGKGQEAATAQPLRIYEQLLRLAASQPDRLRQLDDVMRIVKGKDYAAAFAKLYATLLPIIPKLKNLL